MALISLGPLQGHLSKKVVGKGVFSGLLKLYMVSVAQKVDSAIHPRVYPLLIYLMFTDHISTPPPPGRYIVGDGDDIPQRAVCNVKYPRFEFNMCISRHRCNKVIFVST